MEDRRALVWSAGGGGWICELQHIYREGVIKKLCRFAKSDATHFDTQQRNEKCVIHIIIPEARVDTELSSMVSRSCRSSRRNSIKRVNAGDLGGWREWRSQRECRTHSWL
jgi:hypothetical protein